MANSLTYDGEDQVLEIAFRGGSPLATLDFGLTNAALVKSSVLADAVAGEPAGFGYARVTITQDGTGWPASAQIGSGWEIGSEDIVFTASGGDITPFGKVFLTDGVLLLAFWDVATSTIPDGDSFTFVAKLKLT